MKKYIFLLLFVIAPFVNAQDITSNLIGHWPLNGTLADMSNSGFDATTQGGVQFGNGVNGDPNAAAVFNGSSAELLLDHTGLLNLGENFTIAAWIKLDAFPNNNSYIFSTLDVQTGVKTKGYGLGINTNADYGRNAQSLVLSYGNNLWSWDQWTSSTNSIQANQWIHVAVTVQGSSSSSKTVTFYVDAVAQNGTIWATPEDPVNWGDAPASNRIGNAFAAGNQSYFNGHYFDGSLADIRVYDRALTAQDITTLSGTSPSEPINIVSLWSQDLENEVYYTGKVGIGTSTPDHQLTVKGTVHAQKVKVSLNVPGPDYVFEPDYKLPSLREIQKYITRHKHLPEVPPAKQMEALGIDVGDMSMVLLKKIEELTLYQIQLLDKLTEIEKKNLLLEKELEALRKGRK